MLYNDSRAVLFKKTTYTHTLLCPLEFLAFPFDSTVCSFGIELVSTMSCQPVWNTNHSALRLASIDGTAALYKVSHFKFDFDRNSSNSDGMIEIQIKYLVSRLYMSYLVTTFFPCIILTILGIVTLEHFKKEDFSSKINVTVNLLIVIAMIYSQTVSYIPQSSTPKLIEMFFFYCLLRLSIVFILHTFPSTGSHVHNKSQVSETRVEIIRPEPNTDKSLIAFLPSNVSIYNSAETFPATSKSAGCGKCTPDRAFTMGKASSLLLDISVLLGFVLLAISDRISKEKIFYN